MPDLIHPFKIVADVAACYPEDVWPNTSPSADAAAARGARVACRAVLLRLRDAGWTDELNGMVSVTSAELDTP